MSSEDNILNLLSKQREFFNSGATKNISFRINQLKKLKSAIIENENEIYKALKIDLGKCEFEAYSTEIGITIAEIDYAIKNLSKWAKPKKVPTPLLLFISSSYIYYEPFGVALIIAPWNYPFQLLFSPLVGSISAGNCAILKPSEIASATSSISKKIISENFNEEYLAVVEGGIPETQKLLEQKFDYIFFTGGTEVGRIVYQSASKHLTPVTLELGGKSPCIIDFNTDLPLTVKRVAWGKFINCGQTCVAPDYVLIDKRIKTKFIDGIKKEIQNLYGEDIKQSNDYCRIINEKHFSRLENYLKDGKIIFGGRVDKSQRYIEPTLMEIEDMNSKVMQDEIFGPILPIIEYDNITDAIKFITSRPKPLALYIFSKSKEFQDRILNETSSGGVCINETIMHIANSNLPFGGVGDSGIGSYHGQSSFETFSHRKSVMKKSFILDIKLRYAPYGDKLKMLKLLMSKFL